MLGIGADRRDKGMASMARVRTRRLTAIAVAAITALLPGPLLAVKPRPPVSIGSAAWVTPEDYPPEAMRNGKQGTVEARLAVNPAGQPDFCSVISSSGDADLDKATCSLLMQRARFIPARDARGRAARGVVVRRVKWQIPPDEPESYSDKGSIARFWLDGAGNITSCKNDGFGDNQSSVIGAMASGPDAGCASIESPVLEKLFGKPLAGFAYAEFRILLLTEHGVAARQPEPVAARRVLSSAGMDIAPDGSVGGCKNLAVGDFDGRRFDFCGDFVKIGEKIFVPATDGLGRRATAIIEVVATRQAPAK